MTPKEQFNKFRKDESQTLRAESQKGWFLTSLSYAQAQLADAGATFDEMNGVNRFIETLKNLAADEFKPVKLPVKQLQVLDGNGKTTDLINQPDKK